MRRRTMIAGMGALAAAPAGAAQPGTRPVPKGFWWGTAISAHQSEGNNVNSDSWVNEHVAGTLFKEPSGDACDSYERFGEDIALAALDHYKRVLEACRAHGLAPVVTFAHFTTPRWFAARGGFEHEADAPDLFARFADKAARHFGPLMAAATTFNEINAPRLIPILAGPIYGRARPMIDRMLANAGKVCGSDRWSSWVFAEADRVEGPTRVAHARAYAAIKAAAGCPVGLSISMQDFEARPGGEARAADYAHALYDSWFGHDVPSDFIGVQAYTRILVGPDGPLPVPPGAPTTDAGYEYYPPALGRTVRYAAKASGKPVIITESGIATGDDRRRIAFIDATLAEVRQCLAEGIDLRGYLHWSLLDNFEWTKGYSQQFGLVSVDRTTFKRTPKPSAFHLGQIARSNRYGHVL